MKNTIQINKMKSLLKLFFIAFLLFQITTLVAQSDSTKIRPVQLSLIYPLGTNGLNAPEITNMFSINMIAGYSGGVKGIEMGGFVNMIRYNMHGIQMAGFANLVKGTTSGAQMAGFLNLNRQTTNGIQMAGFANIVGSEIHAVQFSGFANIVGRHVIPEQESGDAVDEDIRSHGAQFAGFANIVASDITALQAAGFSNINNGNTKGAQVAGFMNLNNGDFDGLQVSGFLNYGKKIKGMQLGVFNLADTIENGIALGVLSYVKKGYQAIELSGSETIHGILSVKTGTKPFYNVLSIGSDFRDERSWALGYGIGTLWELNKRFGISLEAHSYHLNEKEIWTNELNMLNKVSANLSFNITGNFSVFGGASYNVAVSQLKDEEGNVIGSSLVPWYAYNETHRRTNIKMYTGFNFGARYTL